MNDYSVDILSALHLWLRERGLSLALSLGSRGPSRFGPDPFLCMNATKVFVRGDKLYVWTSILKNGLSRESCFDLSDPESFVKVEKELRYRYESGVF